jgi:hypothetical protein
MTEDTRSYFERTGRLGPKIDVYLKAGRGRDDLPAWHFALDFSPAGWGSDSGVQGFAHAMARHLGRPITLRMLRGWASTPFRGEPTGAEG